MPAPEPVLDSLIPGNGFLIAQWTNNPYTDINNAYLLVVKTTDYSISYIYLTETQALEQTYQISGLENGTRYLVQYTQTQNAPDGIQGSSETQSGTPLATPRAPTILDTDAHPITIDFNSVSGVYTINLYIDYGVMAYNPPLQQTIFKLIAESGETSTLITSQVFDIVESPLPPIVQYSLTTSTANTYAISAFNVNANGVGNLSNVVTVNVGTEPFTCNVTQVVSGLSTLLTVSVETPDNLLEPITSIDISYSTNGTVWTAGPSILRANFTITSGVITATTNITGLSNNTGYYVRANAVNDNGVGPYGTPGTGVPAIATVITSVTITNANSDGNFSAIWSSTPGSFTGVLSYNYVLNDVTNPLSPVLIAAGIATNNNFSTTGLDLTAGDAIVLTVTPVDTVGPESLVSYWTYPVLVNTNRWVEAPVDSNTYLVSDIPLPPADFICIGVGDGLLTYSWTPDSVTGFNDPTSYTIGIYTVGDVLVQSQSLEVPASQYIFGGLTNDTEYTAKIYATNADGNSDIVTTGPNTPLAVITPVSGYVGPIQGEPSSDEYPLIVAWDPYVQEGYTFVNYHVEVYEFEPGSTTDYIVVANTTTTNASYTYLNGKLTYGYLFIVNVNVTIDQLSPPQPASSTLTKTNNFRVAAAPTVTFVSLTTNPDTGNGVLTFTVNDNLSPLQMLASYVIPEGPITTSPIQQYPTYYSPFQLGLGTYTANLPYPVPSSDQSYAIYAVNGVGTTIIQANLN